MRILIVLIFLLNIPNCFSQIPVVLAMPEYNVVYYGYNNLLQVSTTTKLNPKFIELKCEEAKLERKEGNLWNLKTFTTNDSLELIMLNSKNQQVIDRFVYVVKKLPDPELFLGATENGGKASRVETRLFAVYVDSPLKAAFTVKQSFVVVEGFGNVFVFDSNRLGIEYQEIMKDVPSGAKVRIKAIALGPDGLEHTIYGEFFY